VAVALAVLLGLLFVWSTLGEIYRDFRWKPRVDFTMYHAAAQTAAAGEDLYHFHEPGGYRPHNLPYPYPPLLASLLSPLGKLSIGWAYHLWIAFIVLCLGLLSWLTAKVTAFCGAQRPLLLALGALFLSMLLVDSNVYWGQVNIPVMTLVASGLLLYLKGKRGWGGALIGFAAALKVLPAALALFFLVRRDWRALGACLATALGLVFLVPALVGGPSWAWAMNREWLDLFYAALSQGSQGLQSGGGYVSHLKNGSIVATFDRIFGGAGHKPLFLSLPQDTIDSLVKVLRLGVVLTSAAATLRIFRPRAAGVERHVFPLVVGLLLLCTWLINILLWDHHLIGLVLILPVVAAAALDGTIDPRWRRALWIGLVAGVAGLSSGWFNGSRRWGLQSLCFLILWGSIAWALIHAPAPPDKPQGSTAPEKEREASEPSLEESRQLALPLTGPETSKETQ
jgi:hypothetical protein